MFRRASACPLLASSVIAGSAWADYQLNLPAPKSVLAQQIYDLHSLILWVCAAIFVAVFAPLAYALLKHRKRTGHRAARFHENTRLEIVWTVVPFLILAGMAVPATHLVLAQKDATAPDLTIKVTGHQWKWEYDYLDEGVKFQSVMSTPQDQMDGTAMKAVHYLREVDQPLVVPVGKKVRILATSTDVIHAWWVPELGVKQDAIPGFIRDTWFTATEPGIYRGQCAELCGRGHAYMPIVVEVKSKPDYLAWLEERKQQQQQLVARASADLDKVFAKAELIALGEQVYASHCAMCHGPQGQGVPGAFPALAGSKLVTGPIKGHLQRVLHGKEGTAMAAFGEQLPAADIAAVITFERNSWGNHAGDVLQPAQVVAAMQAPKP
jgi:cytochrome c oxidase subunit 2